MIALLLLLATATFALPPHQREANYRSLPADVGAPGGKMKLVFVNAVWRHGDRSPEQPLPGQGTDRFGEDDWKFGGGGYGELSPTGMIQQFTLGGRIAKRYMQDFAFLTPRYRAAEIYVRSTDYNRTLISAYSNLAGMYSGTGQAGTDLPDGLDGWPAGYVPVPIHTVVNKYDYTGNPDADCKRKAQVKQLILDSDEFAAYNADPQVKATLDWLSSHSQASVTAQNAYWFQDTMQCESIHAVDLAGPNADASKWYPWYFSGTVPDLTNSIVGRGLDFLDGLGNPLGVKGVDVSVEMPRMRAGETIGTIYGNIQGALYCYMDPDSDSCRKFFQKRKYFAISAHDKTLAALLTLLGPKKYVVPVGYPLFAASTFIELFVEEETGDAYFKVLYLATPDDEFKSVTNYVKGCPLTDEYCPLSVLGDIVDKYVPKPDMDTVLMRLIVLLAAAGAVAAVPRSVRNARYAALPADVNDANLELVFAHSLWRHGDRAAEHAVPGLDAFPEDAWTFGGGGYGELSPEGMRMHFNLGRMIRKRYVDDFKILSSAYSAKEIYVRSTDYNRTLISAYSNVAGMYSGFGIAGQNYPEKTDDFPDWPTNYIPIPVHTVDYGTDYVGHPDARCDRQDQLYEMIRNSPEYQSYINDPQISQILKYLSDTTDTDVNIDNMYDLQDPIFCQANHIEELNQTGANIADFYPWFYTGDVPSWVDWIIDKDEDFTNGIANPGGVNGIDVSVEIPKIRAGDTLKLMVSNVHGVLTCKDTPDADECRNFYKKLRYYALSAHDTTVAAFLTILGVKKYIIPEGYPNYSAAVFLEIYEDKTTGERYFKVLYHADKDSGFKPITAFVRGCDPKENTCPIAVLDDLVNKYAPDTDMVTLCNTPPNGAPPTTTVKPVTGTSSSTTTSTTTTTTTTTKPTTTSASSLSLLSAVSVMIASRLL